MTFNTMQQIVYPTPQIEDTIFQKMLLPYYEGGVIFWWSLWIFVACFLMLRYLSPYFLWLYRTLLSNK
ncbi:hypothetical protein KBC86_01080 [Candidatus Gracilibacteria bacterium]|nr:hypothetical protein [Candidatus Gracilibacteria bacterium]